MGQESRATRSSSAGQKRLKSQRARRKTHNATRSSEANLPGLQEALDTPALEDRSKHHNLPKKLELKCSNFVFVPKRTLFNPLWKALKETDPKRPWINPHNLKLKWMAGQSVLSDRLICGERQYPDSARYAFSPMSRFFFPPDVKAVSATEMSITSGGREVAVNAYAIGGMRFQVTPWFQDSPENKNPNGEDVTGTLDSLRMDGGYSHTLDVTRKPTRGEEEKRRLGSTKDFLHKCSDHGSDACDMKPCDDKNFHTNLDGSKCFEKYPDARVKCMYTRNSKQYRPNYSSNTSTLCPGKFISLRNDYDGHNLVAPVSNPNWSWCTAGGNVNTDKRMEGGYAPMFSLPLKAMCRADEYGNTRECRSKLK